MKRQTRFQATPITCICLFLVTAVSCRIEKSHTTNSNTNNSSPFCTDLSDASRNPLGPYQWYLKNTAQLSFSSEPGSFGEDINVDNVLKTQCLSGKGILVGIVDSGLDLLHPSLSPNIDNKPGKSKSWSLNFRSNVKNKSDPSPTFSDDSDHGTMVSGIIGMRSNLGFGGSGVAPRASLSGYNVLHEQSVLNFVDSLGGSPASEHIDIFNMSYGTDKFSQMNEVPILTSQVRSGVRHLRGGKGAIYIKAAGNGFKEYGASFNLIECLYARIHNVSCQNVNMDVENTLPEIISVGAINANGKKASYSTTGSALWISAPGGEWGYNKEWIDLNLNRLGYPNVNWSLLPNQHLGEPSIITTDINNSIQGKSYKIDSNNPANFYSFKNNFSGIRNEFNACQVPENYKCMYTTSMNGTSSATPIISGSVALLLEANPKLTWRDVKYILAKTATQVDPSFSGIDVTLSNGKLYKAELGWVINNAGFHFSNWYGFGRVNVEEAINLAKNFNVNLGTYVEKKWYSEIFSSSLVPKSNPLGLVKNLTIPNSDNLNIESVQVSISAESTYIGNMGLELTSPMGTKSIIWHIGNGFSSHGNLESMPILTNAFYGEQSAGTWQLRIVNTNLVDANLYLKKWEIKISGH